MWLPDPKFNNVEIEHLLNNLRILLTNFSTVFCWPKSKARTLSGECFGGHRWRDGEGAESWDPWKDHTHFGHPVTIVLAVSDGVDNLEVALQGDHHKTDLFDDHERMNAIQISHNISLTVTQGGGLDNVVYV